MFHYTACASKPILKGGGVTELKENSEKLIYIVLAEWLEDEILSGGFPEETQIPSVADLSVSFKLNHITVLKSIGVLTDDLIIYKKRGIGMFVCEGARARILQKRKKAFFGDYVKNTADEARKLGITLDELIEMIERGYKNE